MTDEADESQGLSMYDDDTGTLTGHWLRDDAIEEQTGHIRRGVKVDTQKIPPEHWLRGGNIDEPDEPLVQHPPTNTFRDGGRFTLKALVDAER